MPNSASPIPIAFAITELDPGGAERALVQVVTRLNRDEWSPHVFCLTGEGDLVAVLREAGIPVTCLHGKRHRPLRLIRDLANALREVRPALLQTFLYHANIAGRYAAKRAGVPVVLSGIRVAERRSRLRLWIDRFSEKHVDRHVCVSQGVAEFSATVGGLCRERITVIPNGVDFERFANAPPADLAEFGIPEGHKAILSVGRLDRQKGIMTLLKAFIEFPKSHPDVHLLFVGDGPLRRNVERVTGVCKLESRIHFAGYRDDVPNLMRAADGLVLASRWEGMPNVVLEAMAAELPVVATRVEGVEELLQHERTGRLVPPDDFESLATELSAMLTDPGEARRFADTAQQVVREHHSWDGVAERYASLFRELIAKKGHTPR